MFVKLALLVFILLEAANVLALYFAPGSRYANAVGVFTAWEKSKQDTEIHEFVKYLVNWVAGAKLIFLLLLAVIFFYAGPEVQRFSLIALALATGTFFWRLFPLIRRMDGNGQIEPRKYSMVLGIMILGFIVVFVLAAVL
jgi:hypothetical protein